MGRAGEFNRVSRDGDVMEGDLQLVDGTSLVEFLNTVAGVRKGAVRSNGDDLEFWDATGGVWVKLSSIRNTGLTSYFYEEAIATAGQTVFTISTYPNAVSALQVLIDGVFLSNTLFTETDPTTVTLDASVGLLGGERVIFLIPKGVSASNVFGVTATDSAPSYAEDKIVSTDGSIVLTVTGAGGDEKLDLSVAGGAAGEALIGGCVGRNALPVISVDGVTAYAQQILFPVGARALVMNFYLNEYSFAQGLYQKVIFDLVNDYYCGMAYSGGPRAWQAIPAWTPSGGIGSIYNVGSDGSNTTWQILKYQHGIGLYWGCAFGDAGDRPGGLVRFTLY